MLAATILFSLSFLAFLGTYAAQAHSPMALMLSCFCLGTNAFLILLALTRRYIANKDSPAATELFDKRAILSYVLSVVTCLIAVLAGNPTGRLAPPPPPARVTETRAVVSVGGCELHEVGTRQYLALVVICPEGKTAAVEKLWRVQ